MRKRKLLWQPNMGTLRTLETFLGPAPEASDSLPVRFPGKKCILQI